MNPNLPLRFSSSQGKSESPATLSPQSLFFGDTLPVTLSFKNTPRKPDIPLNSLSEVPVPSLPPTLPMPALEKKSQERTQLGVRIKKGAVKRKLDDI